MRPRPLIIHATHAEVELANGKGFALIDLADIALAQGYNWCRSASGYAFSRYDGGYMYLHRLVMGLPDKTVDHADRNRLDNRAPNLRLATKSQQLQNSRRRNQSGYKGVCFVKRRAHLATPWHAQIKTEGRQRHLGYYSTPERAAEAYDDAAVRAWGDFALTNRMMREW